jgi:hypothetical protein
LGYKSAVRQKAIEQQKEREQVRKAKGQWINNIYLNLILSFYIKKQNIFNNILLSKLYERNIKFNYLFY